MRAFAGIGTRDEALQFMVLVAMPEYAIFLKEEEVIFLAAWKVLFFCLLKRVSMEKVFVLSLVEFNHQGVNHRVNNHLTGLWHELLNDKGLTP